MSRANTKQLLGSAAIVRGVRQKLLLCDKLYRISLPQEVNREYIVLSMRSHVSRYQYEREATGTSGSMQNIGQDTIKNMLVALPPDHEQERIVEYITHASKEFLGATSRIRKAVDTLSEYRAALITNVVTGKIDVRNLVEGEAVA